MLRFSVVGMALMATCSFAQTNPIQVSASTFKGYRTSSNTQTVRDLGFMGNVGQYLSSSVHQNTFLTYFQETLGFSVSEMVLVQQTWPLTTKVSLRVSLMASVPISLRVTGVVSKAVICCRTRISPSSPMLEVCKRDLGAGPNLFSS